MKVYSISDLHLSLTSPKPMNIFGPVWDHYWEKIVEDWSKKVTAEDIVLIAGDISWAMKLDDAVYDIREIDKMPGKKVFIRGNHDFWWKSPTAMRAIFPQDCFVVQNDSTKIDKFIFCGTRGWQVPETTDWTDEDKKMLSREAQRLELSLKSAQQKMEEGDVLICMMHFPPFNSKLEPSIFTDIMEKYGVKKCVYGHLHGKSKSIRYFVRNDIEYYLTSCDKVKNKLVTIYGDEYGEL